MPLGSEHLRLRDRAATALEVSGLGGLVRRVGAWRGLLVLNYHQVANRPEDPIDPSLWSATQDQLDEQLRFLRRHLEVVGPAALDAGPGRRAQVMLTFDDGYRDNHDLALPVLRAHDVPAVFFVTSSFLDVPRLPWWGELQAMLAQTEQATLRLDRWPAPPGDGEPVSANAAGLASIDGAALAAMEGGGLVSVDGADFGAVSGAGLAGAGGGAIALDGSRAVLERLRATYESVPPQDKEAFLDDLAAALGVQRPRERGERVWMTWNMVRALRDAGMTIGGHTAHHPRLADLATDDQAREVTEGLRRLEAELGERPSLFSYPYGGRDAFDARTVAVLRDAGVRFAFSYYGGYNTAASWDPYDLRRVSATATATEARRHAMVTLPRLFARW